MIKNSIIKTQNRLLKKSMVRTYMKNSSKTCSKCNQNKDIKKISNDVHNRFHPKDSSRIDS